MSNKDIIFPTEDSVKKHMLENNIKKLRLYRTAYVNHMNKQDFGYSIVNINSDYYHTQKTISTKTKTFTL